MLRLATSRRTRSVTILVTGALLSLLAAAPSSAARTQLRPSASKFLKQSRTALNLTLPPHVPHLVEEGRFDAAVYALKEIQSRGVAADFLLGFLQLKRGKAHRALTGLRRAARAAWPLQAHAASWLGEASLAAGRPAEAIEAYQKFLAATNPGANPSRGASYYRYKAQIGLAAAYVASRKFDLALRAYRALPNKASKALRREAAFGAARVLEWQRKLREAASAYRSIWLKDPISPFAERAERADNRLEPRLTQPLPEASEDALARRTERLYKRRRFADAQLAALQTLAQYPDGKYRPAMELLRGVTLYFLRRNNQGMEKLRSLLRRYPGSPEAVEARYWLTKFAYRIGEGSTLFEHARTIVRRHPKSEFADNAAFIEAAFLGDGGNLTDAVSRYRAFLKTYRRSKLRPNARWALAWSQYRLKRYRKAEASFARLRVTARSAEQAAIGAYWSGRCLEHLGQQDAAAKRYSKVRGNWPETYVAVAAGRRLERLGRSREPLAPRFSTQAWTAVARDVLSWERIRRDVERRLLPSARRLIEGYARLGLVREAAQAAMNSLSRQQRRQLRAPLSLLFARAGRYDQARALLMSSATTVPEERRLRVTYPLAYPKWTRSLAAAEGLDVYLPLAVMRVESRFNPEVVSPAGAVGLMQLMPNTARGIALERRWAEPKPADLRDPRTNLRYGITELGRLWNRFDGNLILTIAGYNADANRVAEWWAARGDLDDDEFIASIPFTETRLYVQRVLAGLHFYHRLYGEANGVRDEVN